MIVTVIVVSLLTGIGVMSYGVILSNSRKDQARQILTAVGAAQSAWYSGHNAFVAAGRDATGTAATDANTSAAAVLHRTVGMASGGAELITYVPPATAAVKQSSTGVWTVSAGRGYSITDHWDTVWLTTMSSDGKCVGASVVPPHSGLSTFGPAALTVGGTGNVTACSAGALMSLKLGVDTSATVVPGAPVNFGLTPAAGRIVLTWDPPASTGANDPATYVISYTNGAAVATVSASATSYTDSGVDPSVGLDPATSYGYKILARNSSGDSATVPSVPGSAHPLLASAVAPTRPTGFVASWAGGAVRLDWDPPAAGSTLGYELWRDGTLNGCLGVGIVCTGGAGGVAFAVQYLDSSAAVGATYTYQVRAVNSLGTSPWATTSFTTPASAPTALTATALAGVGDASCGTPACARLTWTPPPVVAGVTPALVGYKVFRCTNAANCAPGVVDPTNTAVLIATTGGATTTYTDTTLTGATTYTYRVAAFNATTSTALNPSAAASVSTVAPAPTLAGTAPGPSSIVLTWGAVTGAGPVTGYKVWRIDDAGAATLLTSPTGVATLTFTDTGASLPGGVMGGFTPYTYKVAALTGAGTGIASAEVTVMSAAAPIGVVGFSSTLDTVTLTWTRRSAVTYTLTRVSPPGTWTTGSGTFTDSGLSAGTSYTYTVTGAATNPITGASATSASAPVTVVTVPGAPVMAQGAQTASGTTTALAWTAPTPSTSLTGFKVYRCTGAACTPTTQVGATTAGGARTFADSSLAAGSTYRYAVAALTSGGESVKSAVVTLSTIPVAVTLSVAGGVGTNALTWTASVVADRYRIYRDGAWLTDVPAGVLGYTDSSIMAGVGYSYQVSAANGAGQVNSNTISTASYPEAPTGLSAPVVGPTSLTLGWLSTGADGYQVYRCTGRACDPSAGTLVTTATSGSPSSFVDTALAAQTWYTYAVTAGRAGSPWVWSAASSAFSVKTVLAAPAGPAAVAGANGTITLTWATVPGAASYVLTRDGTTLLPVAGAGTSTYTDTGLANGRAYSYTVRAVAANGENGPTSAVASATTVLPAPTGTTVTTSTTSALTLAWNPVTDATGYQIYGCSGAACYPAGTGMGSTSAPTAALTLTGLSANTAYTLWVRATTTDATSANSPPTTAWTRPLSAVAGPNVTGATSTSVSLSWPASSGATSYQIYRDGLLVSAVNAPATTLTEGKNLLLPDASTGGEITGTGTAAGSGSGSGAAVAATATAGAALDGATGFNVAVAAGATGLSFPFMATAAADDGQSYTFSIWARAPAGSNPVYMYPALGWINNDGVQTATVTGTAVATSGAWTRYVVTGVAPAGTAKAYPYLVLLRAQAGYLVSADTNVNVDDAQLESGTAATSFTSSQLLPATTHAYTYTITNPGGVSGVSGASSATLAPGVTTGVVATAGYRSVSLSWAASPSATGYKVYRCAGAACAAYAGTLVGTTAATSLVDSTATGDGTTYRYVVLAYNASGDGIWSATSSATTTPPIAAAPTFSAITSARVTVGWAATTGASTYQLYRDGALVYTGAGATFADTGLNRGQTYSYTVAAGNATGYSPQGPAGVVTLVPGPVTNLAVTTTATTGALSWSGPLGATSYTVTAAPQIAGTSSANMRTNWSTNPAVAATTAGYGTCGGALTRVAQGGGWATSSPGLSAGCIYSSPGVAAAGQYWSARATINGPAGRTVSLQIHDGSSYDGTGQTIATTGTPFEVSVVAATPTTGTAPRVYFYPVLASGWASGEAMTMTNVLLEKVAGPGVRAGAYFTGSTPGAAWDGAVDASTSHIGANLRANLATNPNFETGTTGWNPEGGAVLTRESAATPAAVPGLLASLDVGSLGLANGATAASAPSGGSSALGWTAQNGGALYQSGGANGQGYLKQTAAGTGLRWAGNLAAANSTVIYVAKQRAGGSSQRVLSGLSNNWLLGRWGGLEDVYYSEGWVSYPGVPTTTNLRVYTGTADIAGDSYSIYRDGGLVATTNGGSQGPNGLSTNGYLGTSEFSDADLYGVYVYDHVLSAGERATIDSYLSDKYDITVSDYAASSIAGDGSGRMTNGGDAYQWSGAVAAGDTITFSMDYSTTGTVTGAPRMYLVAPYGSAATTLNLPLTQTAPGRFSVTATATGGGNVLVAVFGPAAGVIHFDNVLVERSATANRYFDGNTSGAAWDGAANASTSRVSTRPGVAPVPSTVTLGAGAGAYTFSGLTTGAGYTFTVTANGASGSAPPATVDGYTLPDSPLNLAAVPGKNTVALTWDDVPGATTYTVSRNGGAASAACTADATPGCTDTALADATSYSYTVTAYGPGGSSLASAPAVVVVTKAAAPATLTAAGSGTTITTTWAAVPGTITGYKVYRCAGVCTPSGSAITTTAPGVLSFADNGLAAGGSYTYKVTAVTAGGFESTASPTAWATVITTTPTALTAVGTLDTSSSLYSAQVLADSPWGFWQQRESSGTTLADSSGNARAMTLGPRGPDFAGTFSGAAGANVTVPSTTALDTPGAMSIEAWVKPTATGTWRMIATKGATPDVDQAFQFRISPTDQLSFSQGNGTGAYYATASAGMTTGVWHHVAATKSAAGAIVLYVDGTPAALDGSVAGWPATIPVNTAPLLVGTRLDGYPYAGGIADLALYNTTLSGATINAHISAAGSAAYDAAVMAGAPLGYWPLATATAGARTNLVTNPSTEIDTTGYTAGNGTFAWDGSWANSGTHSVLMTPTLSNDSFAEDGGDVGGMRLGMVAGGTYTASTQIRLTGAQSGAVHSRGRRVVVFYSLAASPGSYVEVWGPQAPNAAGSFRSSATFTLPPTTVQAFIRLYNGAPAGAGNGVWFDSFMLEASSAALPYFDGASPFAAWNGAANASTSTRATGAVPNKVAGGSAGVSTGVTFGATGPTNVMQGGPDFAGTFSGAAGVNVTVPSTTALDTPGAMSIEAWVKPTATGTWRMIATKGATPDVDQAFQFRISPTDQLSFSQGNGTGAYYATASAGMTTGVWHHVAATKSAAGAIVLYVDGTPAALGGSVAGWPATIPVNTAPLLVGTRLDGYPYAGGIADLALYNTTLSGATINAHISAVGTAYDAAVLAAAPLGYWPLATAAVPNLVAGGSAGVPTGVTFGPAGPATLNQGGPLVDEPAISWANAPGYTITAATVTTSSVTEEAWVNLSAYPAANTVVIGQAVGYLGAIQDKSVYIDPAGRVNSYTYPGTGIGLVAPAPLSLNSWHHIILSVGAAGTKLRIDKVTVATNAATTSEAWTVQNVMTRASGGSWTGTAAMRIAAPAYYTTQLSDARTDAHYDVANTGVDRVTLAWGDVATETSYSVYRCTGTCTPSTGNLLAAGVAPAAYVDTSAAPGIVYTYAVGGVNAAGVSALSASASAYTPPAAPATPTVGALSPSSVVVNFTAPAGVVTGLLLYRNGAGVGGTLAAGATTFTDAALTPNTTYTYTLAALNGSGTGRTSPAMSATTTVSVPATPVVSAITNTTMTLTWAAVPGASGYTVYGAGAPVLVATATAALTGLTPGTAYTLSVTARRPGFESAASGSVVAITTLAYPANLAVDASGTRTNLVTNPSFETNITGWAADVGAPTLTADAGRAYTGSASLKLVSTNTSTDIATYTTAAVTAGATYTLSYYVYSPNARTAYFDVGGAASAGGLGSTPVPANTWTRVSASVTATATGGAQFYLHNPGGPAGPGTTLNIDGVLLEASPGAGTYFDGSSPYASWTGAANASTSTLATGAGAARLTWSAVPGAGGYRIYRCATAACTPTTPAVATIGNPATAAYIDASLANGTTYGYAIDAYSAATASTLSPTVTALTVPTTPGAPTQTSATASSITLSWAAVATATSYVVYNSGTPVATVAGTSATVGSLAPGGVFALTVVARNGSGDSLPSAVLSARTAPVAPVPTLTPGYRQIVASWTSTPTSTSYTLTRCTGVSCTPATTSYTGTALTDTDTGLVDDTIYGYTITATNAAGSSTSPVAYKTTAPGVPTLGVGTITTSSAGMSWADSPTADTYRIFRNGTQVASLAGTVNAYTDPSAGVGNLWPANVATGTDTLGTTVGFVATGAALTSQTGYDFDANPAKKSLKMLIPANANRVTNPSSKNNISRWQASYGTGGAGTFTQGTDATAPSGSGKTTLLTFTTAPTAGYYIYAGTNGAPYSQPATQGATYSASMAVKPSTAGQSWWVGLYFYTAAGANLTATAGAVTATPANAWTTLSVNGVVAPAGAAQMLVLIYPAAGPMPVVGATVAASAALLVNAATPGAYFDGDSAGAAWDGTAELSTSHPTADLNAMYASAPVTAGVVYSSQAWLRLPNTTDPTQGQPGGLVQAKTRATFYNAAGAVVGASTDSSVLTLSATEAVRADLSDVTAPAGAATVRVQVVVAGTSSLVNQGAIFTDGWWLSSPLRPNATYSYTVQAGAGALFSPVSAPLPVQLRPTGVSGVHVNGTYVAGTATIAWDHQPDVVAAGAAGGYNLYLCTTAGVSCALPGAPTAVLASATTSYQRAYDNSALTLCFSMSAFTSATAVGYPGATTCIPPAPGPITGLDFTDTTDITLLNGWGNYCNCQAFANAGFTRTPAGVVTLRGMVSGGTTGTVIGVLPVGARPDYPLIFQVSTNPNVAGRMDVYTDGSIVMAVGNGGWVSLDGITFLDAGTTNVWTPLARTNGWVNYGLPWAVSQSTKDAFGRTFIEGLVGGGSTVGTASDVYTNNALYDANKALDADPATFWHSESLMPHWVQGQWPTAQISTSVVIQNYNYSVARTPRDFLVQASNDGTTWTTLRTLTGITWALDVAQTFTYANTTPYTFYRLYISASNGDNYMTMRTVNFGLVNGAVNAMNTPIGTLPAGQAPSEYMHIGADSAGGYGLLSLGTDGTVQAKGPTWTSTSYFSLQAMAYSAGSGSWNGLPLVNGWAVYPGFTAPAYTKAPDGLVTLKGFVRTGAAGTVIATLPAGYRPTAQLLLPVATNVGVGRVDIDAAGNIIAQVSDPTWTSLDGITFMADPDTSLNASWVAPANNANPLYWVHLSDRTGADVYPNNFQGATSFTQGGLTPGARYTLSVQTSSWNDPGLQAAWGSAPVTTTVTTTPDAFTATGTATGTSVPLTWTSAGPDVTYDVYRSGVLRASNLTALAYTDTIANNVTYAYSVVAKTTPGGLDTTVKTSTSNTVSLVSWLPAAPFISPTFYLANATNFVITCPDTANDAWMNIYRYDYNNPGAGYPLVAWHVTPGTAWTDPAVVKHTTSFDYWCSYGNNGGESAWGPGVHASIPLWNTMSLINGWVDYSVPGYGTAQYTRTDGNVIQLKGLVKNGVVPSTVAVLPVGYRPTAHLLFQVISYHTGGEGSTAGITANGTGRVDVWPTGEVQVVAGMNNWVSLSGINFLPVGAPVNTNWTAIGMSNGWVNYGSGYSNLSMALDTNVRVHLQGLIRSGTNVVDGAVIGTTYGGWQPVQYMHLNARSNSDWGLIGFNTAANIVAKGATWTDPAWTSVQTMTYANGWGTWNNMALVNGWVFYGGGFTTPQFAKGTDGLVSLKGLIRAGVVTGGTTIFTLPVGYRPAVAQIMPAGTNLGAGMVDVLPDGRVVTRGCSAGWTSLDGITFMAEQ